jgi:hypothetical protein
MLNNTSALHQKTPSVTLDDQVTLAMRLLNGLLVHPDGQRTALYQGWVVRFLTACCSSADELVRARRGIWTRMER